MARVVLSRLAAIAAMWFLSPQLVAAPGVALPADVAIAEQGQTLTLNGLPLDTYALRSARTPAELVAAINCLWRHGGDGLPVVQQQAGDWLVISQRNAAWIHTAQWRTDPGGGSVGILSAINLERPPAERVVPRLAMPASVLVRSYAQTLEPGATYTQFVATSSLSAASLRSAVVQIARRTHWVIGPLSGAEHGAVIPLQRGAVQLDLIVAPDPAGSSLLINQRESTSVRR